MNKENKLGMGLGALLSTTNKANDSNNGVQKINISQIIPNPSQPRKNFKDEELKELSSSIKSLFLIKTEILSFTVNFKISSSIFEITPETEVPLG